MKKLISIVAPMYNEEQLVEEYCNETLAAMQSVSEVYDVELVLVMTVEPGFGGQSFMTDMCDKLRILRQKCRELHREEMILQVDGGINRATIAEAAAAGANCFVAGSAIFGKPDYKTEVDELRLLARQAAR